MKLQISPYLSLGPIKLGMPRAKVREALSSTPREVQKSAGSQLKTDSFGEWNLQVFYRDDYICTAINVFPPASAIFQGRDLLSTKYSTLLEEFKKLDPDLEVDASSFISRKFGVLVHALDPSDTPEDVMVFERGYYD